MDTSACRRRGPRRAGPVRRASERRSAPGRRGQPWTGTASTRRAPHRPHSAHPPAYPAPSPGRVSRTQAFSPGRVSRRGLSGSASFVGAGFLAWPRLPAQALTLGRVCRHKFSESRPPVPAQAGPSSPPPDTRFQPRPRRWAQAFSLGRLAAQVLAPGSRLPAQVLTLGLASRHKFSVPARSPGAGSRPRLRLLTQGFSPGLVFRRRPRAPASPPTPVLSPNPVSRRRPSASPPDADFQSRPRRWARASGLGPVSRRRSSPLVPSPRAGSPSAPSPDTGSQPRPCLTTQARASASSPGTALTLGLASRHKPSAPTPVSRRRPWPSALPPDTGVLPPAPSPGAGPGPPPRLLTKASPRPASPGAGAEPQARRPAQALTPGGPVSPHRPPPRSSPVISSQVGPCSGGSPGGWPVRCAAPISWRPWGAGACGPLPRPCAGAAAGPW